MQAPDMPVAHRPLDFMQQRGAATREEPEPALSTADASRRVLPAQATQPSIPPAAKTGDAIVPAPAAQTQTQPQPQARLQVEPDIALPPQPDAAKPAAVAAQVVHQAAATKPTDPQLLPEGGVEAYVSAVGPVHPQQVVHQIARQQAAAAQDLADHVAMAERIERMNTPQSLAERLLGSI